MFRMGKRDKKNDGRVIHICARGIDRRDVFFTDYYFNQFVDRMRRSNAKPGSLPDRNKKNVDLAMSYSALVADEKYGEILKFACIPNHFHIEFFEYELGNVGKFASRLINSYTKYVNTISGREGRLFGSRSNIIPAENDRHFLYLPIYIDLNPLDLIESQWREKGVHDPDKAWDFLMNYEWSSFGDYFGKNRFSDLINVDLFYELYETNENKYKDELFGWLGRSNKPSIPEIDTIGFL